MNRIPFSFLSVVLLCCAAAAQNLSSDPATGAASAAVQPGVTETVSPEIVQFQKIEDSWSDAVNRRDQYGLELVLSPLFVDVSASGDVTTRNQQVAQVLSGEDKTLYLTQKVVTVRMLGDIAVANGTYTLHHKVGSSQVDEKGIFTQVFERVHGGWLCINSQRTVLRQDASTKKRESSPETPFHLPNPFSRSDKGPQ
ncbi:MAG: nuclear transport factor 2 family protein [Terracidiphilus sp.]|jgi:ketosteroid isomerase-like protein